jgi:hypothetical protein
MSFLAHYYFNGTNAGKKLYIIKLKTQRVRQRTKTKFCHCSLSGNYINYSWHTLPVC